MILPVDVSKKRAKKTDLEQNKTKYTGKSVEIIIDLHEPSIETSGEPFVSGMEKTLKRKFVTKKRKAKGPADEKKSWERKPIQSSDYDLDFDEEWLSWILSGGWVGH